MHGKKCVYRFDLPCQTGRFLKSEIPIYNSKVPETGGKKTKNRKRRTLANAKRYVFYANAIGNTTIRVTAKYKRKEDHSAATKLSPDYKGMSETVVVLQESL